MKLNRPDLLRYRQVHLDFHTSIEIPDIGADFSIAQFQEALKRGRVDSVTLFSKCHHGLSYHPTKIGKQHPGLDFDLLSRQIEACRAIDVKCPIYLSAGFDEWIANTRPQWIGVSRGGGIANPLEARWREMAFDGDYLDYLCEQITEVVRDFDASDGIFLDIIRAKDNFSPLGMQNMRAAGVHPTDDAQVAAWNERVLQNYFAKTTTAAKDGDPNRRVFHNSGHINKGHDEHTRWNSHLELESLPTGGWGYDHSPLSAKYAATTGYDFLGMTGKFHTTWGEFGGFKRSEALQYECAAMLAFGAKCSIGDQLHPSGAMNFDTYDLIGAAYAEVEAKQAWCVGAAPISPIAILSPEAVLRAARGDKIASGAEQGASRMLLELGAAFDVIDLGADFCDYQLLILPDVICCDDTLQARIAEFLNRGGCLILSGASGLNLEKTAFALDCGLELQGKNEWEPDYLVATDWAPSPKVRGPFVIHGGAFNVLANDDFQVLATRREPYFNRNWEHFCSHQHTPDAQNSDFSGALCSENVAYFAHSIFTAYRLSGQPLLRDLFADALHKLHPQPVVETSMPSAGRVAFNFQARENRSLLHLLFAIPQSRGENIQIIEELVPLFNVAVTIRPSKPVKDVRLVPGGEALKFSQENGEIKFIVPRVLCHQMVELSHKTP